MTTPISQLKNARDMAKKALRLMAQCPNATARLAALEEIGAIVVTEIENTEPEARIQAATLGGALS